MTRRAVRRIPAHPRTVFAAALVLACVAGGGDVRASAFGPPGGEFGVRLRTELPWAGADSTYIPAQLVFTNRSGQTRRIRVAAETRGRAEAQSILSFELAPGVQRVELPVLRTSPWNHVDLAVSVDGRHSDDISTRLHAGVGGGGMRGGPQTVYVVHVGRGRQALAGALSGTTSGPAEVEHAPLSAEALPRSWAAYAGFGGVVALDAKAGLDPAQRRALTDWVRFGGGVLWLYADARADAVGAAEAMGLTPGDRQEVEPWVRSRLGETDITFNVCCTGALAASRLDSLEGMTPDGAVALARMRRSQAHALLRQHRGDGYAHHGGSGTGIAQVVSPRLLGDLLDDLHEVPTVGYCFLSVLLAVVIGPVNLVVLARRRRLALFYLTAPALALGGMLLLAVYSIVSEGLGVSFNERAVLVHDLDSGAGAAYQIRGYYAGLGVGEMAYPAETVALPLRMRDNAVYREDWSRGHTLASGFVPSRTPSAVLTVTPVRVRMGLRVEPAPGGYRLRNDLSHPVRQAWVRIRASADGDAGVYRCKDIAPGESVDLGRPVAGGYSALPSTVLHLGEMDWEVVARTERLPYLQDGGVGGRAKSGEYVYVGLRGSATGARPAPRTDAASAAPEASGPDPEDEEW